MKYSLPIALAAVLGACGLFVGTMLPSAHQEVAGLDAGYPAPPPLHVAVPTEPYAP